MISLGIKNAVTTFKSNYYFTINLLFSFSNLIKAYVKDFFSEKVVENSIYGEISYLNTHPKNKITAEN